MGWPYDFASLSPEEKLQRRQTLDLYACTAHYSALAPALVFLVFRLARRAAVGSGSGPDDQGQYEPLPRSPVVKARRRAAPGRVAAQWRRLRWWLLDDVYFAGAHWGQRDEWILGLAWTTWLLALCVLDTGKDYFHLTKRFGAIAISQFPIQYLMALKALNPFAWVFRSSHEEINRYHRVLGRIIYLLLVLHVIFYNVYFFVAGTWLRRFFAPIVFCGVVAFVGMHGIATTSMVKAREYSYRLFFITHLVAAFFIPILIFFHAPSARLYVVETLVIFLLDLGVRKVTTVNSPSTLEIIPGTDLVKISCSIPPRKLRPFKAFPGSHIYLNIPPGSRTSATPASQSGVFDFLYNPFTVASVNEDQGSITIIARTRGGPMTAVLNQFASSTPGPPADARKIPLAIEGPYGAMGKHFHDLLDWDAGRILLVAGGVGATFALPIYQAIRNELPTAKVQLVWAIRSAGDATWAVPNGSSGKSVLNDPHIQLFLTGDMGVADDADDAAGGTVEMGALHRGANGRFLTNRNRRRPDIEKIVDDTFRQGLEEPIAVLVCGPAEMSTEVRRRVRLWVMRGRKVWWHSESFGW
ncbi:Putative metalloreductase AIM14 [Tolypocladium paradoxum]|uniref:Metalloreductase AIM14 n=1 Tax=Tolypocladium paradoxum TaxID=94208 RepID=A0A2S4L0E4_9HYPO|nr:Putative metalloreductase AIM14 [Tolypocladium paradoxum]